MTRDVAYALYVMELARQMLGTAAMLIVAGMPAAARGQIDLADVLLLDARTRLG